MGPSSRPDAPIRPDEVELLLDIAERALVEALHGEAAEPPDLDELPTSLHAHLGVFVTLTVDGELNGCVGDIGATEPIGQAVARLALAAAFEDPRLPALRRADLAGLAIEISLLSPLEPLDVHDRSELIAAVRPGEEGLVVELGLRRGLFLPDVWEQLPDPDDFIDHLWLKAGIAPRTWPRGLRVLRFTTEHHERRVAGASPAS